jgi:hypothetical protein
VLVFPDLGEIDLGRLVASESEDKSLCRLDGPLGCRRPYILWCLEVWIFVVDVDAKHHRLLQTDSGEFLDMGLGDWCAPLAQEREASRFGPILCCNVFHHRVGHTTERATASKIDASYCFN